MYLKTWPFILADAYSFCCVVVAVVVIVVAAIVAVTTLKKGPS
jgi:hypothetical protein